VSVDDRMRAFRAWRISVGLTQAEAAAVCGVAVSTLHRLERGVRPLTERTWAKLGAVKARWTEDRRPKPHPRGARAPEELTERAKWCQVELDYSAARAQPPSSARTRACP
jgi:transcriptional regulator with XRE-family HTH domain